MERVKRKMTKAKFVEWKIPPSMIYVEVDRTWDESFQKGTITCTCPHCEIDREDDASKRFKRLPLGL